jgi:hypothetical protein
MRSGDHLGAFRHLRIRGLCAGWWESVGIASGGVPERSNGAVSKVADPRTAATAGKTLARKLLKWPDLAEALWTFGSGEALSGQESTERCHPIVTHASTSH